MVTLQFSHERRDRRKREYVMIELNHDAIIDILRPISEENQKAFSLASKVEVGTLFSFYKPSVLGFSVTSSMVFLITSSSLPLSILLLPLYPTLSPMYIYLTHSLLFLPYSFSSTSDLFLSVSVLHMSASV